LGKEIEAELILDCPACRSKAGVYYASEHGFFVCCKESDRITKSAYATEDEAISAWNSEIIAMRKANL
jgi:hypothetical protein